MSLQGKTAIVTGGAMGIGRAIVDALAEAGAQIVIADCEHADLAAEEVRSKGYTAHGATCDVSREKDAESLAAETVAQYGAIDILVNNAGIYSSLVPGPFEEQEAAQWRSVLDVNVIGLFLCCKAVVGEMRANGGGRIINVSSGTPFKGVPYMLHYVASKGAVNAITRSLARELGYDKILVNGIAPGFTLSDGVKANPAQTKALSAISREARVIKRDQLPRDVAGAAVFLSSPASEFITGQTLVVDGGAYFH